MQVEVARLSASLEELRTAHELELAKLREEHGQVVGKITEDAQAEVAHKEAQIAKLRDQMVQSKVA